MLVLPIELYLFIPLSMTLTTFQGHCNVGTVLTENFVFLVKLKLQRIIKQIMNIPLFFTFYTYSRERVEVFSNLTKTLTLAFLWTLFMGGLSNFVSLLRVQLFIPGLMTLTLFQGHRYVRIINHKLFFTNFRFLFPVV